MSEELIPEQDSELELQQDVAGNDEVLDGPEEFEEITSDEVDRVVESLEQLIETVGSENIQTYLEDALNSIYYLIYDEEDENDGDEMIAEAA